VLMAAAKRAQIDAIGDTFERAGIHIHSIDARVLGWLELLRSQEHIDSKGCEILIIDDGIDFTMAVLNDGIPISLRALHEDSDDMNVVEDLVHEISYTLTTLDAELDLPQPASIDIWNFESIPTALRTKLAEKSGLKIKHFDLGVLPPLSQGIIDRTLNLESRIELIPREWVEFKERKALQKKFGLISGILAAVWLFTMLVFFGIYKARDATLAGVRKKAEANRPQAEQALQNREKLKALKVYADRSDSSIESLREVTRLLPAGDIEFVSFNYTKGKAITLRGTARSANLANNYFSALNKSSLFDGTNNESVSTKTTKGVRRAIWNVTLPFPEEKEAGS